MKLSTKARIQQLLEKGERRQSGALRFYRLAASSGGEGHFGILIAKKHFPLSVDRNRIRRVIRESWRLLEKQRQGLHGNESTLHDFDFLVTVGSGVIPAGISPETVLKWLEKIFLKPAALS